MKVIVGLGNPGREYAKTRHNVGWMVIERLARQHQTTIDRRWRRRLRVIAMYGDSTWGSQVVRLLKPSTMMNRSGQALAVRQDLVAPEELLLVCDDVNLSLGRLRLRARGRAGGHHGLQSCFDALGTERVARLRIGVGGGEPGTDLARLVLSPFSRSERLALEDVTSRAAQAVETWVENGIEVAMNRYNSEQRP